MEKEFIEIVEVLNHANVRYVVAGRPKDLVDIEYIERVRNERSSKQ